MFEGRDLRGMNTSPEAFLPVVSEGSSPICGKADFNKVLDLIKSKKRLVDRKMLGEHVMNTMCPHIGKQHPEVEGSERAERFRDILES